MNLTKDIIFSFLSDLAPKLMTVATSGDHPWIATVYYGFDTDLNLYFISDETTVHAKHILENANVAVAIADTTQKPEDKKKGIQLYGKAFRIDDVHETEKARVCWVEHLGIPNESLPPSAVVGRMYKIKPSRVKYFNQELFDVEDGQEPILELS
jgi:uncharacterized protein YhbP (UPF0306 family)